MREAQFGFEVHEVMDRVMEKLGREMHMDRPMHHFDHDPENIQRINPEAKLLDEPHPDFEATEFVEDSTVGMSDGTEPEIDDSDSIRPFEATMEKPVSGVEIRKDLSGDLDPAYLDSLLAVHFRQREIETEFVFAVFNVSGVAEIQSTRAEEFMEALQTESYIAEVHFPGWGTEAFQLRVYFPELRNFLFHSHWGLMLLSILILLLSLAAIISAGLGLIKQRKLSKVKTDFINNITHELKTPISTISLACEALSDPDMQTSDDSRKIFVNMISEENKRLGTLVENVLRTAQLDQGEIRLKKSGINMHEVIAESVRNLAIQVKKQRGTVKLDLTATDPIVHGDRIHLTNVVFNLIDNAMKYSVEDPIITVSSQNSEGSLELTFADNGIGISKEHRKKIFDPLYRIPTGDVHNVKGFGLGLSYVKTIIDKHHGTVSVQSEPQKGSSFIIKLALHHE